MGEVPRGHLAVVRNGLMRKGGVLSEWLRGSPGQMNISRFHYFLSHPSEWILPILEPNVDRMLVLSTSPALTIHLTSAL